MAEITDVDFARAITRPGEVLAVGKGFTWLAYETDGVLVAACYVQGRLLRRDTKGWWVASSAGDRRYATGGDAVALLGGSGPDGWPVFFEQVELCQRKETADAL